MTNPGETKVFLMENATTKVYTYVEREICSESVNGSNDAFTVSTAPVGFIGEQLTGSATALSQFVDANGNYMRRDVLVEYRKDGADSVVDTNSNAITISSTTVTFTTPPATSEADSVVVSYYHTASDRSDEIVSENVGGGGRPVEYITVQGGKKIRVQRSQEAKTVQLEVLSVDGGFASYINGVEVTDTSTVSGSTIKGTVGAQDVTRRAIITAISDPETGNKRIECMFNVVAVTDENSAPSDGRWSETVSFECPPQDYNRLTLLDGQ